MSEKVTIEEIKEIYKKCGISPNDLHKETGEFNGRFNYKIPSAYTVKKNYFTNIVKK